jgi:hypothetical protein
MSNKMFLILPDGADSILDGLERHMAGWRPSEEGLHGWEHEESNIPFESHAYEALVCAITYAINVFRGCLYTYVGASLKVLIWLFENAAYDSARATRCPFGGYREPSKGSGEAFETRKVGFFQSTGML